MRISDQVAARNFAIWKRRQKKMPTNYAELWEKANESLARQLRRKYAARVSN